MKKWIALVLAVVMLLALAACGSGSDSSGSAASDGGTSSAAAAAEDGKKVLRAGSLESGGGFNPVGDNQAMTGNNLVYERLVQRMPDGQCEPWLCESYEWTDPTTMVIHMRDDAYFSDGDRVQAEDVNYSFWLNAQGMMASYYSCIDYDATEISDDGLTLTWHFNQEYGPFESLMDTPQIVNKSAVENLASDEPEWWDQPIGSGPYEVVENIAGSHATYRLRDNYWKEDFEPQWDEIIVNYYSEPTAMFIAFENGELDVVCSVAANDAARLAEGQTQLGDKAAYEFVSTNNVYCLTLSNYREELQDPKVREAIAHAVDVDGLGQVAFGTLYNPADSVITSTTSYYVSTGQYEYDVEYAKQCMAESAYPDGFTLNVVAINAPEQISMWEVIQGGLEQLGITMNFQTYDLGTALVEWMKEGATDMMLMSVNGGNPMREPYMCLSMTQEISPFPAGRVLDADYQEHFNNSVYTSDTDQRAEEMAWVQNWLHDNFQALPMVEDLVCYAYNTDTVDHCEFYTGSTPSFLWCFSK